MGSGRVAAIAYHRVTRRKKGGSGWLLGRSFAVNTIPVRRRASYAGDLRRMDLRSEAGATYEKRFESQKANRSLGAGRA
jgi:hypothetical protein